jgi:hypothetical protein
MNEHCRPQVLQGLRVWATTRPSGAVVAALSFSSVLLLAPAPARAQDLQSPLGRVDVDTIGITSPIPFTLGGTGQTSRQASLNALFDTATAVDGDLFCYDGTNIVRLPKGAAGEVLSSTGAQAGCDLDWIAAGVAPPSPYPSVVSFTADLSTTNLTAGGKFYVAPGGRICDTEAKCRTPVRSGTINNLDCLMTIGQTATSTAKVCTGACSGALTCDGSTSAIATTAFSVGAGTNAPKTLGSNNCISMEVTAGASAMVDGYLNCTAQITG